ncbi:peroxidase family protein, partial [Methylobacterium soli]|uniref:peroxidase family protein n=1 Tax=Methylobacterium soli TaxID=553447 RepID=UPI0035A25218
MAAYSVDGSGNNLSQPGLNAAGTNFARLGAAHFADGISSLVDGPNPRTISNIVVGEGDPTIPNPQGLSGMLYAWGQFIDHDLDLSLTDHVTPINVLIPAGDAYFAAGSLLPMTRAVIDPATGAGTGKPAIAVNAISGWLVGGITPATRRGDAGNRATRPTSAPARSSTGAP